jgi:type IV pilus assembly protein PilM
MEEVVIDYLNVGILEEGSLRKQDVLLVAADRKVVTDHTELLRNAGLQVGAVDINPLALINLISLNYEDMTDENVVFVDLGADNMEINIAKQSGLRFTRNVAVGMDQVTQVIERSAGIGYTEAERLKRRYGLELSRGDAVLSDGSPLALPDGLMEAIQGIVDGLVLEVQRSIDFYHVQFRRERIRKIIFVGGGILMPGLLPYLSNYFDVETVVDNPFARIHHDPISFGGLAEMAPRFSTAVGLALRPQ